MTKPRIYISGRMTGLPEFNFPAFNRAAAALRAKGWEVENPAESFGGATDKPYKEYVAFDIAALERCDAIYMLPGWDAEGARGSVWEHGLAKKMGLTIIEPHDNGVLELAAPSPEDCAQYLSRTAVAKTRQQGDATAKPTNPKDAIGSNKLPLHLWPTTATAMGCLGLLDGELKYGRSNYRMIGVRASIYYDAARRHLDAWFEGENTAPDNDIPHLAHALACLAIIVDAEAAGKLNDDRMLPGGYRGLVEGLTPHVARLKQLHAGRNPKHYTIADSVAAAPSRDPAVVGHIGSPA